MVPPEQVVMSASASPTISVNTGSGTFILGIQSGKNRDDIPQSVIGLKATACIQPLSEARARVLALPFLHLHPNDQSRHSTNQSRANQAIVLKQNIQLTFDESFARADSRPNIGHARKGVTPEPGEIIQLPQSAFE
jgi:hypothetical protein